LNDKKKPAFPRVFFIKKYLLLNMNQIQPLKGTRSLYPKEMCERNFITNACREVLERAGYEEYEAPVLEPMSLYEAKSSTEIIERQSYVFTDRGGEKIVVRPELTPSFARMVANKQRELPPLIRWFSFADCWRYERPQKGRTRNFLQLNVDFLGSDSVEADVETIDLALSLLKASGIDMESIEMRVNDRKLFDDVCAKINITSEQKGKFLTLLDERDKLTENEFFTKLKTINISLTLADLDILNNLQPSERLLSVIEGAKQLGWNQISYDANLMRGFSYYTGIVFEVTETSGSFKRAIFGGGRYDNLLEAMGGSSVSGIGFGVSDVALLAALETQNKTIAIPNQEKTFIIPFSEKETSTANTIARQLRARGKTALVAVPPYDFKKQLTMANRLGAESVVLIAPKEIASGNVIVKNMKTGEQKTIPMNKISYYGSFQNSL